VIWRDAAKKKKITQGENIKMHLKSVVEIWISKCRKDKILENFEKE
jgi:hypothetical protein